MPQKDLIFPDYSGIESRANAWVWNEEWKLEVFRKFDRKEGPDNYVMCYARTFNVDPATVKKPQRQLGKVIDLFGQYEGGVGAFVKFADTYGIKLDPLAEQLWPVLTEEHLESAAWMWKKFGRRSELSERVFMACDGAKQIYRAMHQNTAAGWKELRSAAILAIENPGKIYSAARGKILFKMYEGPKGHRWLQMKLPSGRKLSYFKPRITVSDGYEDGEDFAEVDIRHKEIRYWGVDTDTRRWMETGTYGGKLNENAIQGISRDLLAPGLIRLEQAGYPPVGSVHDEGILEVESGFGSLDEAGAIMCKSDPWAAGLPIAFEGHRAKRYRK